MKPASFWYHRPGTREEVDALLAEHGEDAKILAGGQSLVPILNMRLAEPGHLVDINGLGDEPAGPVIEDGVVVASPLVRVAALERSEAAAVALPIIRETVRFVAHPPIRNRSTVAGSIAHADPAAELPALLSLLDGRVRTRGAGGSRTIAAADLFVGPLQTALQPGEWIEQVEFPLGPPGAGYAFEEFSRRSGDFALCGVGARAVREDGGHRVALAYLGMGEVPARLELPVVEGGRFLEEAVDAAVDAGLEPFEDIHATVAYRMHLARRLGARAAHRAIAAANGSEEEGV